MDKATPGSYWLKYFPFCEGLGRPIIKVKESSYKMETITSTMVLHKHVYGSYIRFTTMYVPFFNKN